MPRASTANEPGSAMRVLPFVMFASSTALLVVMLAFRDLPMVDLPQHAAQIASWIRLDDPTSGVADRFELNLRTPYLLANAVARFIAPFVGVVPALKLVVWAAVVGNMLALWALSRRLGHDPWIGLLGLISACGLCFYYGFISFMLAIALGLFAVLLALEHARAPTLGRGAALAAVSSLTLLAHGVAYTLCMALMLVVLARGPRSWIARFAPLAVPQALALVWFLPGPVSQRIGADVWDITWRRWVELPALLAGIGSSDRFATAVGVGTIALAVLLLGLRPARSVERWLLLVGLLAAYGIFPGMFRGITWLHTRMPTLLLPVLLLALSPAPPRSGAFVRATRAGVLLLTVTWFGVFSYRLSAFNREAASYHEFLRGLPPGLSMRPIIFERNTRAFPGVPAYVHYAAYYYVERGGLQGYSFAMYPTSVVRYRPGVKFGMLNAAEWRPDLFDGRAEVSEYDFFLVRSDRDRGPELFAGSPEPIVLARRLGSWWGYAKASSKSPHGSAKAQHAQTGAAAPLHVVLVTLDGARAHELFEGTDRALADSHGLRPDERPRAAELTPALSGLIGRGAVVLGTREAPMRATGPNFISLPGYAELMTGRGPSCCADNDCHWVSERTIIDDLAAAKGCDPAAAGVVTSWPDIGRVVARDARCAAMSTGRTGGVNRDYFRVTPALAARLDRGATLDPAPGVGDFRRDRETGALAAEYLTHYRPRFLFVGLGESDEYAHHGNYRGYLRAIGEADQIIGRLARTLEEFERQGSRTALFVTTDHGRAGSFRDHGGRYPESAAVWLVAFGTEIGAGFLRNVGATRRLSDITPTLRHLFGLSADPSDRAGQVLSELLVAPEQVASLTPEPPRTTLNVHESAL